jgi:hypothetical protein
MGERPSTPAPRYTGHTRHAPTPAIRLPAGRLATPKNALCQKPKLRNRVLQFWLSSQAYFRVKLDPQTAVQAGARTERPAGAAPRDLDSARPPDSRAGNLTAG